MVLMEDQSISVETLRLMASFASCLLFVKIYDWLRLFEGTAFYILLIEYTLRNIKSFLLIIVVALLAFGIPLSMLDLNRESSNPLIDSPFGFWLLDSFYN